MTTFPTLQSGWQVCEEIASQIDAWHLEFLALYERQQTPPLQPRELPAFGTIEVRHAGRVHAEEHLPAVILSPTEESGSREGPNGRSFVDLSVAVLVAHETRGEQDTGDTLHAYLAVLKQLLLWVPPANGRASKVEYDGGSMRGIQKVPDRGVWLASELRFVYRNVEIGNTAVPFDPYVVPREDPYEGPMPGEPTVETAHLVLDPTLPEDVS